jgi:hypothetical protein
VVTQNELPDWHSVTQHDIVGFFDALLEDCADLDHILRQSAALVRTPLGINAFEGRIMRVATFRSHEVVALSVKPSQAWSFITRSGVECWTPSGGLAPLDDKLRYLLQRCAIACSITLAREGEGLNDLAEGDLVRLAVAEDTPPVARAEAIRRLHFKPGLALQVVLVDGAAVHGDRVREQVLQRISEPKRSAMIKRARSESLTTFLVSPPVDFDVVAPIGAKIALGSERAGAELHLSAIDAKAALRFTLASTHEGPSYWLGEATVMDFRQLSVFGLLARHLPAHELAALEDVRIIERLSVEHGRLDLLRTLEVVSATDSLRKASTVLRLHHNSVAHRVAIAEQALGYSVTDPYGRFRVLLTLVFLRLRGEHGTH